MGATAWTRGDPVEVAPAFLDAVGAAVCAGVLQPAPRVSGSVTVRGVQRSRGTASLLASLESGGRAGGGWWWPRRRAPSTACPAGPTAPVPGSAPPAGADVGRRDSLHESRLEPLGPRGPHRRVGRARVP